MDLSLNFSNKKSFLNNNFLFLVGCLLSAVPIWLSTYPPMLDIPLHANQVATFLRLLSDTELLTPLLKIEWLTPYWTGYASVALLGLFMPIVTAIKIVLSVVVVAIPWFASRLRALVSNDNSLDWLFIPVAYSFSFQYGLLNFMVGIPIVLIFLRETILYFSSSALHVKKAILLTFLSYLLFLTHIFVLAFALIIAFPIGIALSENIKKSLIKRSLDNLTKQDFLKLLPFFSSLPIIFLWFSHVETSLFHLYNFQPSASIWLVNVYRFLIMLSSATGLMFFYKIGAIYAMGLFFLSGAKILRNWRALPFIITILILLIVPTGSSGGNFIAERFNVFIFIFYVFSFDFSRMNAVLNYHKRVILFASISFLVLLTTAYKTIQFDRETIGLKNSFMKMEPHRSVATIIDDLGEEYSYSVFGSVTYWYHAEKNGYGNSFFAIPSSVVQFKSHVANPFPRSQFLLSEYIWDKNSQYFDYFIIKGDLSTFSPDFLRGLQKYASPIYHEGKWHLYARRFQNTALTKHSI